MTSYMDASTFRCAKQVHFSVYASQFHPPYIKETYIDTTKQKIRLDTKETHIGGVEVKPLGDSRLHAIDVDVRGDDRHVHDYPQGGRRRDLLSGIAQKVALGPRLAVVPPEALYSEIDLDGRASRLVLSGLVTLGIRSSIPRQQRRSIWMGGR